MVNQLLLIYVFSFYSSGYSCASIYKDTVNLGSIESGREVYPCTRMQGEVNELWSLDLSTYQWTIINSSEFENAPKPPAREQHSSLVIDKNLYIFGGKSRSFPVDNAGNIEFVQHSDEVYGDLWMLSVERPRDFQISYPNESQALAPDEFLSIPQDRSLFAEIDASINNSVSQESDGIWKREGLCIDKLIVHVKSICSNSSIPTINFQGSPLLS